MQTDPTAGAEPPRSPLRSPRFLAMFGVFCMVFALGQFHRSSGAVLSPLLIADLELDAGQIGLVIGAMFIAQGLIQLPSGVLIDRFGTRIVLPSMVLIGVAGCLLMAYSENWVLVTAARMMIGLGFSTTLLGPYTVFVHWSSTEMIATLTGRLLFVGGIGGLLATFPFAYVTELFDWREVFTALGIVTLAVTVVTYIVVRDLPDDVAAASRAAPAKSLRDSIFGLWLVLKDRRIWPVLSVALFLYSPLQILVGLWAGPFLKDVHHMDAISRSYILLGMSICMSVGTLIYGPLERHFNTRRGVVLTCTILIAALFLMLAAFGYADIRMSALLFFAITMAGPYFLVVLAHNQVMFPREFASRVVSLINLLAITGIFVTQYVSGLVIRALTDDVDVTGSVTAYRTVFALMGVTYILVTLSYSRIKDIPPRTVD